MNNSKRQYKVNKLVHRIFELNIPMDVKEQLCVYLFNLIQNKEVMSCARQLIKWIQMYNIPHTKLFLPNPNQDQQIEYWWAMDLLPPNKCLDFNVDSSQILRKALVEYVGSDKFRQECIAFQGIMSPQIYKIAAYLGALQNCRTLLLKEENSCYDDIIQTIPLYMSLPHVLEMVLRDIQENTLRLTEAEANVLITSHQFSVIQKIATHFSKQEHLLLKEVQDEKKDSNSEKFYSIGHFFHEDNLEAFKASLTEKELKILEIEKGLSHFRNKRYTITIGPDQNAERVLKESAIIVALSQSYGKFIVNEDRVKDPEARLILEAAHLNRDAGTHMDHILVTCKKFLPLLEKHLSLNPFAQRIYYKKFPESLALFAEYYNFSLGQFKETMEQGQRFMEQQQKAAVSLYRRIKNEGRDYLLKKKQYQDEEQFDPEYALIISNYLLEKFSFNEFKEYLSSNQDLKLLPTEFDGLPYRFKEKGRSLEYLQVLGERMELEGSSFKMTDNWIFDIKALLNKFGFRLPCSLLVHLLDPYFFQKLPRESIIKIAYSFALEDRYERVLQIVREYNLKSIESPVEPPRALKEISLKTLRLMALLTSSNKRAKLFTSLYFIALGIRQEASLSLLENLLQREQYSEMREIATLQKEQIKTNVCDSSIFIKLLQGTFHLGKYDFFYNEMIHWIDCSFEKEEIMEQVFKLLKCFLKKRNSALRIIYGAKGAIRKFVKEVNSYEDMNNVLKQYEELWKVEKKEPVNYVKFQELKNEFVKQRKQSHPRNIRNFSAESLFAFERQLPSLIRAFADKLKGIKNGTFYFEIVYNELLTPRISDALIDMMTELSNLKQNSEEQKEEQCHIDVGITFHNNSFVADSALADISEHSEAITALLKHCVAQTHLQYFSQILKELPNSSIPESVLLAFLDILVKNKLPIREESLKIAIKYNYSDLFVMALEYADTSTFTLHSLMIECFVHNSLAVLKHLLPSLTSEISKAQIKEKHQKIALHIESCCKKSSVSLDLISLLQLSFFVNPKLETVQYLIDNKNQVTQRTVELYCLSGNFDRLIWQAIYVKLASPLSSQKLSQLIYVAFEQTRTRLLKELLRLYFFQEQTLACLEQNKPESFKCFAHYVVLSGDFQFFIYLKDTYPSLLESRVKEQQGKADCAHPFLTALHFKRYQFLEFFPLSAEIPLCTQQKQTLLSTSLSSLQITSLRTKSNPKYQTERVDRLRKLVSIFEREEIELTPPRCALLADVTLFSQKITLAHLQLGNMGGWNGRGLLHYAPMSLLCSIYPIYSILSLASAHLTSSNQPLLILFVLQQIAKSLFSQEIALADFKPHLQDILKKVYPQKAEVIAQIQANIHLIPHSSFQSQNGKQIIQQFIKTCLTIPNPEPSIFQTALLLDYAMGNAHFSSLGHFFLHPSAKCTGMLYTLLLKILVQKEIKPPISLGLFRPILSPRKKNKSAEILVELPRESQEEQKEEDKMRMADHNLVLFFLLLRRLGDSILEKQNQAVQCIHWIFTSLFVTGKQMAHSINFSQLDSFLAKIQSIILESDEAKQEDLKYSDHFLFTYFIGMLNNQEFWLTSGVKNTYKVFLDDAGSVQIANFSELRSCFKNLFYPIQRVRDFFDSTLSRQEVPILKINVKYTEKQRSSIQTESVNTQEGRGITQWNLTLTINLKDTPDIDNFDQQLHSLIYSQNTLITLVEAVLSMKWSTSVEIAKQEFSLDDLCSLWDSHLEEKRVNPVERMRQRLSDQIKPLCGPTPDFSTEIAPGPYLSGEQKSYFEIEDGKLVLTKTEHGEFIARKPPSQLDQIAYSSNIDRAFHSICITKRPLRDLNRQYCNLAYLEERTKLYLSFSPQSRAVQPCIYSHPDGPLLKIQSVAQLKLLQITWQVTRQLKTPPILMWRTLFSICEQVEPNTPLDYFEALLAQGDLPQVLTNILLTYENLSSIYKAITTLLFDFELSPSHRLHQVLKVSNVHYSCYRDAIVAKITLGEEGSSSLEKLTSSGAMARDLLKFDLLVEAFSDLRSIFKEQKREIEESHSIVINLDFKSFVELIRAKFEQSEDPINHTRNFLQQGTTLENLTNEINQFFQNSEIKKAPVKCLSSFKEIDKNSLVYNLFKEEQLRSKTEPYLKLEGEEQGHYQNILLFAIRETDAWRILEEKKGPTPRPVVGIKEITGKPKFFYSKCKVKPNGKITVGSQPFEDYEIVLWTAPFSCDYEAQDAIGPVFLVGTAWDLYSLPKNETKREQLLSKIKEDFPTKFKVQFFESENEIPSSLPLSTVPYVLTETGLKSVWNKVKRPLPFFLSGNTIFRDALFQLSQTVLKIHTQFTQLPSHSKELSLLLQKFKSLELNLSGLMIELTSIQAPMFISNIALALNLLTQFLEEVFKPDSSNLVLPDFSLSNIPESALTSIRLFSCFTQIFSSISLSLHLDKEMPGSFNIEVESQYPQDIFETRRKIEEKFYASILQHLMHQVSQAKIINSTFPRWLKKSPSLVHLFTLPSFEAPILRLKHICSQVHIEIAQLEDHFLRRRVLGLLNLAASLHNIANILLTMQPLFALQSQSGIKLKIKLGNKREDEEVKFMPQANLLEIELLFSSSLSSEKLMEYLAKSTQLKLPSPNGCAAFQRQFGCLLPLQRNELNLVILEFDKPISRDIEMKVFLCSFDQNETSSLQFQVHESCFLKVQLPSSTNTRVFWIVIVGDKKHILLRQLYIRLSEDLENENEMLKTYRKRENCFLVGTQNFDILKPVIIPEQQRSSHIDHHLEYLRVMTPRSLNRKLLKGTEMRISDEYILVKLERAEQFEEAKGGEIHFTDHPYTRYLPFTNRRMQEEGCPQDRIYWPGRVKEAVVMTVLPELPRQIKKEEKQVSSADEEIKEEETKESKQKAGLVFTRYNYEGGKEMKTFESEKKAKEKLNLYDLKVSLEVVLNVFLSSQLAYESLQLSYIQKKKLKVMHKMLDGKPESEALDVPRIVTKLIHHPKSLKGYPVSRAGQPRVEELEVGNVGVESAQFLHLVLPQILVQAKVKPKEQNKVILEWLPPLKGVYQLFINGKLATLPHYQFVVLSSLNYQQPVFTSMLKIAKDITVAKNIEISLKARDRENCIVMPEDYELASLPVAKKDIAQEMVTLGKNGELKAEIRNVKNKDQLGTFEFTFESSEQMKLRFTFFHQTEEVDAVLEISWNGVQLLVHSFLLKPKNFEERFQDFRKEIRGVLRGNRDVQISRFHYIQSIGLLPAGVLKANSISVKFNGEPAWDAGGPRKEFFSMLGEQFTRSKNPRFFVERKPQRYFPVSLSNNQEQRRQLRNFGTLLSIGVAQGFSLEFRCTPALHAALSGISMRQSLLQDEDPTLAKNLQDLRHLDAATIDSLELYFVYSDSTGNEVELLKGGKHKKVTAQNLGQYIKLVGEFLCYKCAEDEIQEIKKGMNLVFSSSKFANFSCEEMNRIMSGDESISREFLKSKLHFYNEVSQPMRANVRRWIDEASDVELHNFLQLITGSRNVSQSEKRNFRLNIDRSGETKRIPSASTCGNQLHLPPYESYEELKKKLDISVNLGAKYFAFG